MRVLHLVPNAGVLSEMWLSEIVTSHDRHPATFWSMAPDERDYRWARRPDRVVDRLATTLRAGRQVALRRAGLAEPLWWLAGRSLGRERPDLVHAHFGTLAANW